VKVVVLFKYNSKKVHVARFSLMKHSIESIYNVLLLLVLES